MKESLPKGRESELSFTRTNVPARRDILHFVEENLNPKIYEDLGKNPNHWIEELDIISQSLTGNGLFCSIGIDLPPQNDPEFKKLGDDVYIYRGNARRLRGIWITKKVAGYNFQNGQKEECTQWSLFRMGTFAELHLNAEFSDIPIENFLPEKFEQESTVVKNDKRPILTFEVKRGDKSITVFAKGAFTRTFLMYDAPSYRLTKLSRVEKTTSQKEMENFIKLGQKGIKVPKILGYYKGPVEEFLFMEKVNGENPLNFLDSHRESIIKQDAEMLANLCLSGYRKTGFCDFDDKIFDGQSLYLVDVDECIDLYFPSSPDFKQILLDPNNPKVLKDFREVQKLLFENTLKDAIYDYRKSLTQTFNDKILYISSFFQKIGWGDPTPKKVKELTTFSKDYLTFDSYISMMADN